MPKENEDFSDEAAFEKLRDAGWEDAPDTDEEFDEGAPTDASEPEKEEHAESEPDGDDDQDTERTQQQKKRRPSARERIQELVGQRNEWQERYDALQRQTEERLQQERQRYERELQQYQQQQTTRQPSSAEDWYAEQMEGGLPPQLDQHLQEIRSQQQYVLQYVEQQRKQYEEQQRAARQQVLVRSATETAEKYDNIPAKVLYHIISRDEKLQTPEAVDGIGRELAVAMWEWADAQGLVFPDAGTEKTETDDEPGDGTPPPLKRPKSAGRRTDRDQKKGKDKNRGRRKRATKSEPDPEAVLLAERLAREYGF